jgi:hypothetical protein
MWWAFVIMVINIWIEQKPGNFLTNWHSYSQEGICSMKLSIGCHKPCCDGSVQWSLQQFHLPAYTNVRLHPITLSIKIKLHYEPLSYHIWIIVLCSALLGLMFFVAVLCSGWICFFLFCLFCGKLKYVNFCFHVINIILWRGYYF